MLIGRCMLSDNAISWINPEPGIEPRSIHLPIALIDTGRSLCRSNWAARLAGPLKCAISAGTSSVMLYKVWSLSIWSIALFGEATLEHFVYRVQPKSAGAGLIPHNLVILHHFRDSAFRRQQRQLVGGLRLEFRRVLNNRRASVRDINAARRCRPAARDQGRHQCEAG